MKISATIITRNEETEIAEAIGTLDFADEIIVVDSESSDNTRKICEELGAHVITQKWLGFGRQKQTAVENCSNDWVFSLDADERVSKDLRDAILKIKALNEDTRPDGYRISRLSYYMEKPIKHCGWYPDWQLRFFDRKKGRWKDMAVHESVEMLENAKIEKLHHDILHFSVKNPLHHHQMIGERYAPLAAKQMYDSGRRTSRFKVRTASFAAFIGTYFLKAGFLDGLPGYCIARFAAHHSFLKHLLLWEMQNKAN